MKNKKHRRVGFLCTWMAMIGFFLVSVPAGAQTIQWAIVNAAGFEDSDEGHLNWTVGETFTTEIHSEHGTLRIGFLPFVTSEEGSTFTSALDSSIEITMYPNPAEDVLYLRVPAMHLQTVRILSMDGRASLTTDVQSTATIDIRSLPAGAYTLYVIDPSGAFNSSTFFKS